jgi:hypothetical protein
MEQALISCFGEMADERTDMQISCRAKKPAPIAYADIDHRSRERSRPADGFGAENARVESPSQKVGRKAQAI